MTTLPTAAEMLGACEATVDMTAGIPYGDKYATERAVEYAGSRDVPTTVRTANDIYLFRLTVMKEYLKGYRDEYTRQAGYKHRPLA